MRLPFTTPPVWPDIASGRFAVSIHREKADGCAIALLGLPDDTGIKLNGGRTGAREGPAAFRAALAGFGSVWDGVRQRRMDVRVFDAGDVEPAPGGTEGAMLETHARVEAAVGAIHEMGLLPVCIGGGHDLTLPSVTALSKHHGEPVGGLNFDAHLDARTRAGSGMAFRRLIETEYVDPRAFVELGLGRFANDEGDFLWLSGQGARLVMADESGDVKSWGRFVEDVAGRAAYAFTSIDLDGINSAEAPGVSAMNPLGLTARHACAVAEAAGACPGVGHFDVMELSPPHDVAGRTARVAAAIVLSFFAGFGDRPR